MRQIFIAIGISCAIGVSTSACQDGGKDYTNPDLPVSERVSALMSQMTLEEKVAQMCQYVGLEHMKTAEKNMSAEDLKHSHAQGFYPNLHSSDVEELTKKGMIGRKSGRSELSAIAGTAEPSENSSPDWH